MGEAEGVYEAPNVATAISADGRVVFFSSEQTGHSYARIDAARTLEVPGPASCKASEPLGDRACFLVASADGHQVLLADGQLYALNGAESAFEATIDLSGGEGGFEGILGAAEDLSRIYFVDTKALTGGEENGNGEAAQEGADNLYLAEGGGTVFVGRLLSNDNSIALGGRFGAWKASAANRTAQVTPDGGQLAFMSKAPLTGYDNAAAGGGECAPSVAAGKACFEVFVYAAATHSLACASCRPSGQRPLGPSNLSLLKAVAGAPAFAQPANLSPEGSGRVFFESQDVLTAQDTNGSVVDVYEWEPAGVGGCTRAGGCVGLISGGDGTDDSLFLDASASGDDAFFITRSRLLPRDRNSQLDLYDARVGGGFPEEAAQSCSGEGCKGPLPQAPAQAAAASSGYVGPGNPKTNTNKKAKKQKKHHKKHRRHGKANKHGKAKRHGKGKRHGKAKNAKKAKHRGKAASKRRGGAK